MAKLTVLLVVLAAATAAMVSAAGAATIPGLHGRRSRFLLARSVVSDPPLPSYDCSRKPGAVCLAPGSPGPTCCGGQCVNAVVSNDHCGGGRCVDLLSDKDNCGKCSNQCNNKCSYGFCDYAQ